MTYQSPRIYLYKITFEEVSYYYYGVKKEKYFNQEYWGSPKTNKWCWDFYTPKKQILQVFPYTDEGWIEAQEVETRLIRPFYNTDKWCLNESCGGNISLSIRRKTGRKIAELKIGVHGKSEEEMFEIRSRGGKTSGKKAVENKLGIHGRTKEQHIEDARKSGKLTAELGIGVHGRTKEQMTEDGRKGGSISGKRNKELGKGIHGRTQEQHIEDGRKGGFVGGKRAKELGRGIHARTKEQMIEDGRKGGIIGAKIMNAQRWECCETGYVSTPAGVVRYQKLRGIDSSKNNRRRIA
jgi:hypothetical protein